MKRFHRERPPRRANVDVIRRAHVEDLAVGAVVLEQLFVDSDGVLNVREVAGLGTVAVDHGRFAVEAPRDKVRHCHIRPHPRTVDSEVAQYDSWKTVDFVVYARVLFARELRDPVGRGRVRRMILIVGEILWLAVHRGGGGSENNALEVVVSGGLKEVHRPVDVVLGMVPKFEFA